MPHITTNLYLARDALAEPSPEFLVGTTLPALMRLYRDRLGQVVTHAELTQVVDYEFGMDFSRAVDRHLAATPAIQTQEGFMADDVRMLHGFYRRFRAEKCVTEGLEMVRDGVIADWPGVPKALDDLTDRVVEGTPHLYDVADRDFSDFVRDYLESRQWERYRSGLQIADVLHRRYKGHRYAGYRFDASWIPRLAQIFDRQRAHVEKLGEVMLHDARVALRAEGTYFSQAFA